MRYGWMPEGLIRSNKYLIAVFPCLLAGETALIYSESLGGCASHSTASSTEQLKSDWLLSELRGKTVHQPLLEKYIFSQFGDRVKSPILCLSLRENQCGVVKL